MTEQHPITPPDELVQQWREKWKKGIKDNAITPWIQVGDYIATQAASWGDEQRLKACCEWVANHISAPEAAELRAAMRPKPPSLAEQALTKIDAILGDPQKSTLKDELEALELSRAALERLQELEKGNE